jgi:hypothetical protein
MISLSDAIASVYEQVGAPDWAAANLDGLADVLRDLSWLPKGEATVRVPDLGRLGVEDARRLMDVLERSEAETAEGPHPVRLAE